MLSVVCQKKTLFKAPPLLLCGALFFNFTMLGSFHLAFMLILKANAFSPIVRERQGLFPDLVYIIILFLFF